MRSSHTVTGMVKLEEVLAMDVYSSDPTTLSKRFPRTFRLESVSNNYNFGKHQGNITVNLLQRVIYCGTGV
jgi:hypothetical protein